jgi:hypothetical protein
MRANNKEWGQNAKFGRIWVSEKKEMGKNGVAGEGTVVAQR